MSLNIPFLILSVFVSSLFMRKQSFGLSFLVTIQVVDHANTQLNHWTLMGLGLGGTQLVPAVTRVEPCWQ
jgi:hypothetical protein